MTFNLPGIGEVGTYVTLDVRVLVSFRNGARYSTTFGEFSCGVVGGKVRSKTGNRVFLNNVTKVKRSESVSTTTRVVLGGL